MNNNAFNQGIKANEYISEKLKKDCKKQRNKVYNNNKK